MDAPGSTEKVKTDKADNRLDPMSIIPDWHHLFPKSNLNIGLIGNGYLLCKDLSAWFFLKKGVRLPFFGGNLFPALILVHFYDIRQSMMRQNYPRQF